MLENNEISHPPIESSKYNIYRERFKIYNRKYRETHQDKIKEIRESENYKKSKELFKERNPNYYREYFNKNKDKILERQRNSKTFCSVCNKNISSSHFNQHSKRQIHLDNLSKVETKSSSDEN